MRILLVEDDVMLGEALQEALITQNFVVEWLKDGESAIIACRDNSFDMVILDLGLPRKDGMEVLQTLRQQGLTMPVLILTARDATRDRVAGLDAGADDYLLKPFDLDELNARLRALLRRSTGRANPDIFYRDLRLDPASQRLFRGDEEIILARREYMLLKELLDHVGQVLTRDKLEAALYGWMDEVESNTLEVHIHHLRKKLGSDFVRTVRGVGYILPNDKA